MHVDTCAPRRAAPMPPDARRAAVLSATVPLLRERGAQVSTRELAEAAGVAEGTLFRVFPDKRALIRAALAHAMDPEPLERGLGDVDPRLPFEVRLRLAVELLTARMDGIIQLMTALHGLADDAGPGPHGGLHADHEARDARVLGALAAVFEPDAARLRVLPLQAAGLVRGAVLGDRMPGLPAGARLTPGDLAACLTGGLLLAEHAAEGSASSPSFDAPVGGAAATPRTSTC